MSKLHITDAMSDEAIEWFVRLRADDVTSQDRQGFISWLRQHRSHQFAFIDILNLWEDLSVVKSLDFEELESFTLLSNEKDKARSRLLEVAG